MRMSPVATTVNSCGPVSATVEDGVGSAVELDSGEVPQAATSVTVPSSAATARRDMDDPFRKTAERGAILPVHSE